MVFASFPSTADRVCQFLKRRLGEDRVVRHDPENIRWTRFVGTTTGLVLICDRRAEEGLNLQNRRSVIVHFDLPFAPNRIEQRMGRLDRFGTGTRVKSYALICEHSELQAAWAECLKDAIQVFDQSIASLQYAIDEEFCRVRLEFPDAGVDAIRDASVRLSGPDGVIQQELRRLRAQDELDAFSGDDSDGSEFFEKLQRFDLSSADFQNSLEKWLVTRLHFRSSGEEGRNDGVVRYQYCRRDDTRPERGKDTFIPFCDFLAHFENSLDDLGDLRPPVVRESVPLAFNRQVAQRRLTRLARIGDPLIDATERFVRWDDRGICFAMWRYRPTVSVEGTAEIMFGFHLTVEADMQSLIRLSQEWPEASRTTLRRRADMAFPPLSVVLWLDSNLERITEPQRLSILEESYRNETISRQPQSGRDFNLNHQRWNVANQVCDIAVWRGLCYAARDNAETILREQSNMPALSRRLADQAASIATSRIQQFESRRFRVGTEARSALSHEISFERAFATALQEAILSPKIRVDSVGAVFLSAQNPFASETAAENDE